MKAESIKRIIMVGRGALAKAVTKSGYKAEVIPAVAKSSDGDTKGLHAVCSKACLKTCTAKERAKCERKKSESSL